MGSMNCGCGGDLKSMWDIAQKLNGNIKIQAEIFITLLEMRSKLNQKEGYGNIEEYRKKILDLVKE